MSEGGNLELRRPVRNTGRGLCIPLLARGMAKAHSPDSKEFSLGNS